MIKADSKQTYYTNIKVEVDHRLSFGYIRFV